MSKCLVIFLFCCALSIGESRSIDDHPNVEIIVDLAQGKVKGGMLKTWLNNDFYGFRGIRYGKPPIGELRYKAPLAVDSWTDIFDATTDGPMCPQPYQPPTVFSEDCLRINVYTKGVNPTELKPVIVYVNGGGYYMGSGVRSHYGGPEYLMEHDIVFVAFNYRLGTLGFLAANTTEFPGNGAFKDQVLALRWIRDNIARFGGDPGSITLFGNSAGASSIALHLVSAMSEGLFHRVIMTSSSINPKVAAPEEQIEVAKKQAKIINCTTKTLDEILSCLMLANAEEMVEKTADMAELGIVYPWNAVVEHDFGQERFLTEDPYVSIKSGRYQKVPIMIGLTKDELVAVAFGVTKNEKFMQKIDQHFYDLGPVLFGFEREGQRSRKICDRLWDGYNFTHPLNAGLRTNIEHLVADAHIGFGIHRFADIVSEHSDVFSYSFSYQGRYSHFYMDDGKPNGVEHADDLIYILRRPVHAPMFEKGAPEEFVVETMTKMLTDFAKTG